MDGIEIYKGIKQFGKAYEIMLKNDSHAPNSVDIELAQNMIKLCNETKAYLYEEYTSSTVQYKRGSKPFIETIVTSITENHNDDEEKILAIAKFCSELGDKVDNVSLNNMVLGGTEEQIIHRGSDWCTDIARVSCVMYQIAGFSSRIVNTFNLDQAYSGHVINEVYRGGIWGVVDSTNGIVYYIYDKKPATSWDVMNRLNGIFAVDGSDAKLEIDFHQFKGVAISNYYLSDHDKYNYSLSRVNDYYRRILEDSYNGWSGGLRWINGEKDEGDE